MHPILGPDLARAIERERLARAARARLAREAELPVERRRRLRAPIVRLRLPLWPRERTEYDPMTW
jgi:hypothetical protein